MIAALAIAGDRPHAPLVTSSGPACLWGAVEAEERRAPIGWAWIAKAGRLACAGEAGPEFERGRRAGSLLSLDEAVALALGEREAGA